MIATDPYGKFVPGPLRGLPQYVTTSGLVEGNTAAPVAVPVERSHVQHAVPHRHHRQRRAAVGASRRMPTPW